MIEPQTRGLSDVLSLRSHTERDAISLWEALSAAKVIDIDRRSLGAVVTLLKTERGLRGGRDALHFGGGSHVDVKTHGT